MTDKHLTNKKFTDLTLIETLIKGLTDAGFKYCTPIQEQSLPIALEGKDVAGQAQTGTGKTVAFLLACCQYLITRKEESGQSNQPKAVILAPTRELAIQIHTDAENIGKHCGLKFTLIYGGTGYEEQKESLAMGTDVLIGTPGRIIDFYKQKLFDLNSVQVAVLDEADRMLDLGFIKDIRYLLKRMPPPENRLNLLFSATLSYRVMELAYEHMNNPKEIKIDEKVKIADKIEEHCYYPAEDEKLALLVNLLKQGNPERVLVFANTRHSVEHISRTLKANNISTAALSGDVPQDKRETLLEGYKTGQYIVLVATDVAARGLHIPEVSHVYNYDLPQDAEDYVHRIGRTARAGSSGEAISFLCEKYAYSIMDIEEYIGHSIAKKEIEEWMLSTINMATPQSAKSRAKSERKSSNGKKATRQSPRNFKSQKATINVAPSDSALPRKVEKTQEQFTQNIAEPSDSKSQSSVPEIPLPLDLPPWEPIALPENRFSRKFGEIPLIG